MEHNTEKLRARIPDDDMIEWIRVLREGGLTDDEIDAVASYLNKTYAKTKGVDLVEEELKKLEEYLQKEYRRILTAEQKEYLRNAIASRSEFQD